MQCAAAENAAFYHPRNPRASPLFRLLEEHYEEFERVYPERYQQRYGFWRPVVRKAVMDFLKCGDLREGFARMRCPDCRHEFFVAYSCKQRCVCPSCHQKRSLTTALRIAEQVSAPVPHRPFSPSSRTTTPRTARSAGNGAHQTRVRGGPAEVPQVRGHDEDCRVHRASEPACRRGEDSQTLRPVGGRRRARPARRRTHPGPARAGTAEPDTRGTRPQGAYPSPPIAATPFLA